MFCHCNRQHSEIWKICIWQNLLKRTSFEISLRLHSQKSLKTALINTSCCVGENNIFCILLTYEYVIDDSACSTWSSVFRTDWDLYFLQLLIKFAHVWPFLAFCLIPTSSIIHIAQLNPLLLLNVWSQLMIRLKSDLYLTILTSDSMRQSNEHVI